MKTESTINFFRFRLSILNFICLWLIKILPICDNRISFYIQNGSTWALCFLFLFLVVYIIWYGTWTTSAKSIIQNFVTNLGATPFWAINKAYGAGVITFKKGIDDAAYSQGKNLTNSMTVWNVVQNALNKALLPKDTNGIYLVLSSRWYFHFLSINF